MRRRNPDKGLKNPNLRRLRYLVKQDLDNIAWWYWLDDGSYDNDIPALPRQAGSRQHYVVVLA
jgi:hypothetical protein